MSAVWTPAGLPAGLVADLRSDQAGETGAVWIYRGVLAVSRDPALRAFAQRHLATERRHLGLIEACLPAADHSRLLPLWRLAGWLTGALPALARPRGRRCANCWTAAGSTRWRIATKPPPRRAAPACCCGPGAAWWAPARRWP